MKTYGLIGKNLSHTYSPNYFGEKFRKESINANYRVFDISDLSKFKELIDGNPNIKGLNVTIPYKKSICDYIDDIDPVAALTGSVNTIRIEEYQGHKLLKGFNTDVIGFEETIYPEIKSREGIRAMILGTGGSANSVAYVMRKLGIECSFVSRRPINNTVYSYNQIGSEQMAKNKLIINTTPVGMFPNDNEYPNIPYENITPDHILYDLIYNPHKTIFMSKGLVMGAKCINGLKMLELQAEASWKIWQK